MSASAYTMSEFNQLVEIFRLDKTSESYKIGLMRASDYLANQAPTIMRVVGPEEILVGQGVAYQVDAYDPEHGKLEYKFSLNSMENDNPVFITGSEKYTTNRTFFVEGLGLGIYQLEVKVRDEVGNEDVDWTVFKVLPSQGSETITIRVEGEQGVSLQYDVWGSDGVKTGNCSAGNTCDVVVEKGSTVLVHDGNISEVAMRHCPGTIALDNMCYMVVDSGYYYIDAVVRKR